MSDPSHTYRITTCKEGALPPYKIAGVPRQRNMAQIKKQIKTLENELSDRDIANLSDAEFKTLVNRMLAKLIELGRKMKEEMKATQTEIKQNIQGTTVKGRKLGLKSMIWNKKKK